MYVSCDGLRFFCWHLIYISNQYFILLVFSAFCRLDKLFTAARSRPIDRIPHRDSEWSRETRGWKRNVNGGDTGRKRARERDKTGITFDWFARAFNHLPMCVQTAAYHDALVRPSAAVATTRSRVVCFALLELPQTLLLSTSVAHACR